MPIPITIAPVNTSSNPATASGSKYCANARTFRHDPDAFVQIHRSAIVNLHYVQEVVPVSRSYQHHFRQM